VSTGLLCCNPKSEPPGWTGAHRFAVDNARPGRLNALAVFAFCAEMTRLPGHCEPRSAPVNATAHTIPSRLTIGAPHVQVETAVGRLPGAGQRGLEGRLAGQLVASDAAGVLGRMKPRSQITSWNPQPDCAQ
jgi:hypothetical protein